MPIPQTDKPEAALARLSSELGSTFDGVVQSIGAIRSSAGEFAASVSVLQGLGSSGDEGGETDGDASFSAFSQRAERAAAAAGSAATELDETTFQANLNSLAAVLGGLKRSIVELAAISSLIKIVKTESPDLGDRLSVFTETLDKRFSELGTSTSEAARKIDSIRSESRDARAALVAIAGELRGISQNAGADEVGLEALRQAHLADVGRMVAESRTLGAQVQSAVGCVIACLQFPDAFAQRIEHLRAILGAVENTEDAGEKSVLSRIAVAHLDAMAEALLEAAGSGMSALDGIPLPADNAERLFKTGEADASLAWIEAERSANDVMIQAVAASRNRLDAAVTLIARIVSAVDIMRAMLEDSRRQNVELNISVHNASIMASRNSSGVSALHVLADGVKAVVAKVSREVASIIADLERIRTASEALQQSPLAAELDYLGRIQQLAARKSNDDTVKLARARQAREHLQVAVGKLASAAVEGRRSFSAARSYAEPLRRIAMSIRDDQIAAAGPVAVDLAWLEAIYTMNEERDIHSGVVEALGLSTPAPAPAPEAAAETDDAELDDFLL